MNKLEEELEKLIKENGELRRTNVSLLKENEELRQEISFKHFSLLEGQDILDNYCDFDILIKTLKKQDNKIVEFKMILKKVLDYLNKMYKEGVSEEEEISLKMDILKLLESKNKNSE